MQSATEKVSPPHWKVCRRHNPQLFRINPYLLKFYKTLDFNKTPVVLGPQIRNFSSLDQVPGSILRVVDLGKELGFGLQLGIVPPLRYCKNFFIIVQTPQTPLHPKPHNFSQ